MKKVLLGLVVALALAGGGFAYFRSVRKAPPPPTINSALAVKYRKSSALLKADAAPDKAIGSFTELGKQDQGNALNSYYLAAAYAKKGAWTDVTRALEAGNDAPYCVVYQREDAMLDIAPNLSALRDLTRDCAAAAQTMSGDRGETLLLDARKMGTRIAGAEPKMLINVLVGVALHSIADRNLAQLYSGKGRTKDAEAAQQRMDTERAWAQSPETKAVVGGSVDTGQNDSLFAKYGLTAKEVTAAMAGKSQPAATKKKLKALNVELLAREKTHAEELLKTMPE